MEQLIDRDGTSFTDLLNEDYSSIQVTAAVADYSYAIDLGILSFIE
jgi:hypothetical protein